MPGEHFGGAGGDGAVDPHPGDLTARLVGHASSKVTETVYRHQLRPVMATGAEEMDALLGAAG
jgi:integrase